MKTLKNYLSLMLTTIKAFFKKYHEFVTLPIAVGLWLLSVPFLRGLDPTTAVFDAGVFQVPILALIQLLLFLTSAWLILKLVFGRFHRFMIQEMKSTFEKLTPWQKLRLSYSIYFLLVLALVLLAQAML